MAMNRKPTQGEQESLQDYTARLLAWRLSRAESKRQSRASKLSELTLLVLHVIEQARALLTLATTKPHERSPLESQLAIPTVCIGNVRYSVDWIAQQSVADMVKIVGASEKCAEVVSDTLAGYTLDWTTKQSRVVTPSGMKRSIRSVYRQELSKIAGIPKSQHKRSKTLRHASHAWYVVASDNTLPNGEIRDLPLYGEILPYRHPLLSQTAEVIVPVTRYVAMERRYGTKRRSVLMGGQFARLPYPVKVSESFVPHGTGETPAHVRLIPEFREKPLSVTTKTRDRLVSERLILQGFRHEHLDSEKWQTTSTVRLSAEERTMYRDWTARNIPLKARGGYLTPLGEYLAREDSRRSEYADWWETTLRRKERNAEYAASLPAHVQHCGTFTRLLPSYWTATQTASK